MKPKKIAENYIINIHELMPQWENIPAEFRELSNNQWIQLTETWMFQGINISVLKEKPEIDRHVALQHLKMIMNSFEPKYEHKIATVAYLMSLWFDFNQAN